MRILVLNSGSSTLKYELWENAAQLVDSGIVERVTDWNDAIGQAFAKLGDEPIAGVGHRVVHGGAYPESTLIDDAVERGIEELCDLAPLHNPRALAVYRAARKRLPDAIHVAVFDTGFHQTIPEHAYRYAIPERYLRNNRIRRYGFHGISHRWASLHYAQLKDRPVEEFRLITCHLGNGCSVCAIDGGKAVDSSMGFTPLEGLVMGTRSGDMDASALLHMIVHDHADPVALLHALNNESGLLALSGVSNDMRDIVKAAEGGNDKARLALDMFCFRVKKYIGAYFAAMNGADALIFTGGIGENAASVRKQICDGVDSLGLEVCVIAAEEGRLIAQDTLRFFNRAGIAS